MKRFSKAVYQSDEGNEFLEIAKDGKTASISKYTYTADELRELSAIASAAAEELDALARPVPVPVPAVPSEL